MFCNKQDLHNESDVEQKLVWPMLTTANPREFGYSPVEIRTKANIRKLVIGNGTTSKLHHPDYVLIFFGIPLVVVEVKGPGEDLDEALREARLYAGGCDRAGARDYAAFLGFFFLEPS